MWYDACKYKGGDFMSQTISVSTTMGEQGFRDFAVFDAFHHRKAWLRPAVFAAMMAGLFWFACYTSTRTSPTFFVTFSRSKVSKMAMAYLREVPSRSRTSANVICPWARHCSTIWRTASS